MRYIDLSLIDENDPEVKEWKKKAKRRYRTLCSKTNHEERKNYLKKATIWSDLKPVFTKIFGEKCWYSECDLTGSYGDIDHFRPKSHSKDENESTILNEGYWWLAYDYNNYRLSCEKCNRPYGDGGKTDYFPLKPGTQPTAIPGNDDIPLLLDPCILSDTQLIDCDESGAIICLSEDEYDNARVTISNKIYNWNCFNTARREVRTKCKTAIEIFECLYKTNPDKLEAPLSLIADLTDESKPYSSFAKKYLMLRVAEKPYAPIINRLLVRQH